MLYGGRMRNLKDKERLLLISKVLCEVYGPLTSQQILDFIQNSKSIGFSFLPTARELSMLLAKNPVFESIKAKPKYKFKIKEVN